MPTPYTYGGPGTATSIQEAMDHVSCENLKSVNYPATSIYLTIPILPGGAQYRLDRALILKDRCHVRCDVTTDAQGNATDKVKFLREGTAVGGGTAEVLKCAPDLEDASWESGIFERENLGTVAAPVFENGTMVSATGNRLTFKDVKLKNWQNGRAFDVRGDDIVLIDPQSEAPVADLATGGIRVFSGRRFRCVGGTIEAYDDALVFAPGPASSYDRGDRSIEDGAFIGVHATGVRVINASLGADGPTDPLQGEWAHSDLGRYATASVRNVRFIGITGYATGVTVSPTDGYGRALKVVNESSSGVVDGVLIADCTVTCSFRIDSPVVIGNSAGGVSNVQLINVDILAEHKEDAPSQYCMPARDRNPVDIFWVNGLTWSGGRIDPPLRGALPTITVRGTRNARFSNMDIDVTAGDAVQIADIIPPREVLADGTTRDIPDFHMKVMASQDVSVDASLIRVAPGLAGVRMTAGARGCGVTRSTFVYANPDAAQNLATRAVVMNLARPSTPCSSTRSSRPNSPASA